MTTDVFWGVPRIEEVQDSNGSPRREEVGRHTLGAIGGFPARFFYRASFGFFTQQLSSMFLIILLRLLDPAADWTPALPELVCSNFLRFVRYSVAGPGSRGGLDACASRA